MSDRHVERRLDAIERHRCGRCGITYLSHGAYTLHGCPIGSWGLIPVVYPLQTVWQEAWWDRVTEGMTGWIQDERVRAIGQTMEASR